VAIISLATSKPIMIIAATVPLMAIDTLKINALSVATDQEE
jgi:hypothetical protein